MLAQQRSRRDVVGNHHDYIYILSAAVLGRAREKITDVMGCESVTKYLVRRGWKAMDDDKAEVKRGMLRSFTCARLQLSSSHSFRLFLLVLSHICANCPVAVIISRCCACACMTPYLNRSIIRTAVLSETQIIFRTAGSPDVAVTTMLSIRQIPAIATIRKLPAFMMRDMCVHK